MSVIDESSEKKYNVSFDEPKLKIFYPDFTRSCIFIYYRVIIIVIILPLAPTYKYRSSVGSMADLNCFY